MDEKLYVQIFSIHGLLRYDSPELGRDADTGGQIKYVLEMAEALSRRRRVGRVDLFTRLIRDPKYAPDYARAVEEISKKFRIVRIQCGGTRYIRKELLWPHLDEYVDKTIKFINDEGCTPDLVHGHYADAGHVGIHLSRYFSVPLLFTGHSLGLPKRDALLAGGMREEEIEKKFKMKKRVACEEELLAEADLIITSTREEIDRQYGLYRNRYMGRFKVVPPGINTSKFFPEGKAPCLPPDDLAAFRKAGGRKEKTLSRFLSHPEKPLILAICRADRKKNIEGLIRAYGEDEKLQEMANLVVLAGIREDISAMPEGPRSVLTQMLMLKDRYDLYGRMAIPKGHDSTFGVPELYRMAAARRGVFVNAAHKEPFGLTINEAAACGLPVVATREGGPKEIIANCGNGILVDPSDIPAIGRAIRKIIGSGEVWKRFSGRGIAGVAKHYRWDVHAKESLKEVLRLADENRRPAVATPYAYPVGDRLTRLKYLIISDIDNTLTGDAEALEKLMGILAANRETVGFAVATGRHLASAFELISEKRLMTPDIFITSVGSEMHYGKSRIPDEEWLTHIGRSWDRRSVEEALAKLPFLTLQEEFKQGPFKVSYYMEREEGDLLRVHEALLEKRCEYNLIHSHDRYLDILPQRASKGKAIRYLGYKWGIDLSNMLVCGDSGNDSQMLKGRSLAVVVGNHTEELDDLKGQRNIYFSDENHAAGIIDGLSRYGFIELSRGGKKV